MATVLHKVKAYLYDNAFTKENPNSYIARICSERSLNVKDICKSAALRGGSDVSPAAMEHAVELWHKEMSYLLCDGFSVNTGWFIVSTHIKGVFDSPNEAFNPDKHTLLFEFKQGSHLRKELETVEVQMMGFADSSLSITQVIDVRTGSVNNLITPGRNLRIHGHKLKIDGKNEANGVYFINQSTQERTKVDTSDLVTNKPSELIVVIPNLERGSSPDTGTYKVEVTTQHTTGKPLKNPRSVIFDKILTVR
jgi:hypothetical protein